MKNDPIKELLDLAEDLIEASATKPQKVPDDVMAKLNHRLFGEPVPLRVLTGKKARSLLLILVNRHQESTASELMDALGKEQIAFGKGDGAIFGVLQKLEKLGYIHGALKERAGKSQRVYRTTDDGDKLVNVSKSTDADLLPLVEKLSIVLGAA